MTFLGNPSHENSLRESLGAASCILRMHDILGNPSHENSLRESLGAASCILRMHDIYRLRAAKRARETTDATIKQITASMSPCIPTNAMTNKNGLLTPIVLTMP